MTPLGCVTILYFVVGFDSLIGLGTAAFPASVTCLLFVFFALLALEALLPEKIMRKLLAIL